MNFYRESRLDENQDGHKDSDETLAASDTVPSEIDASVPGVDELLFKQRQRMRRAQLKARYAEANGEIDEETALLRLQRDRALEQLQDTAPSALAAEARSAETAALTSSIADIADDSPTLVYPPIRATWSTTEQKARSSHIDSDGAKGRDAERTAAAGDGKKSNACRNICPTPPDTETAKSILPTVINSHALEPNLNGRTVASAAGLSRAAAGVEHEQDKRPGSQPDAEVIPPLAVAAKRQAHNDRAVRIDVVTKPPMAGTKKSVQVQLAEKRSRAAADLDDAHAESIPSKTSGADQRKVVVAKKAFTAPSARSGVGRAVTAIELLGPSFRPPLKRSRSMLKAASKGKSVSDLSRRHTIENGGADAVRKTDKMRGITAGINRKNSCGKSKFDAKDKAATDPPAAAVNTNLAEVVTRPSTARNRKRLAPGSATDEAPGPFAELCVCTVRLGSVTKNTVATWTRGIDRGGGRVRTAYTPDDTTHVVMDASLSWDTLRLYDGWNCTGYGRGVYGGVIDADAEATRDNRQGLETLLRREGVPVVSTAWMIECLTRSKVVDVEPYRLVRPRSLDLAPSSAPLLDTAETELPVDKRSRTLSAVDNSTTAAVAAAAATSNDDVTFVGAQSARRGCEDVERPNDRVKEPSLDARVAIAMLPDPTDEDTGLRERSSEKQAKGASIESAGNEKATPTMCALEAGAVAGGIGGANPNVAQQRAKFFCQSGSSRSHRPFNEPAAQALESISEVYGVLNGTEDGWRAKGFKRAAAVMRALGVDIKQFSQLRDIKKNDPSRMKGIGNSAMALLEQFYSDGKMDRLEGLSAGSRVKALKAFAKIWGVGPKTADELVAAGFLTIEDVRRRGRYKLNRQQLIGLDRYEDLKERMPRSEAADIEAAVAAAAQKLCPGVICQACGSFRRGKETCGDVDVLIRPPEGQEDCSIMLLLLESLRSSGFLTEDLALPGYHEPGVPQSYMGVCKLPGEGRRHRRLDVKSYPTSMYGFALLYFTGSGHFNCSMRFFAKLKGLRLNDKGLHPVNRVSGKEVHTFPSYRCPTEEDVFAALGLEWRDPEDRSGYDVHPVEGEAAMHQAMGRGIVTKACGLLPAGIPIGWGLHSQLAVPSETRVDSGTDVVSKMDRVWQEWPEAEHGVSMGVGLSRNPGEGGTGRTGRD